MTSVGLGVLVGTRGFFPASLAVEGRKQILQQLSDLGLDAVTPPDDATPHGSVETLEDARTYAAFFQQHRARINGILVVLPNFGDELGIAETLDRAALGVPVLVHASDDDPSCMDIAHRRDAFCGKLSVCNNLFQRDIPFTITTLHSCPIGSMELAQDLQRFASVCRVVRGVRTARIGMIGQRPNPFNTVRFSEKLLQNSGTMVCTVDLSEIIFAAQRMEQTREVVERQEEIRAYGPVPAKVPEEHVEKQAKLSLAIEAWMRENECDCSAIQCWSSIQENYGCATCLSMSMMGEKGMPSACETDVTGALTMYALRMAAGQAPGYLDWNNNYGGDRDKCVCLHCSNFPRSFIGEIREISNLDILGASLGEDRCFGGIKGQVAPGPMTYAKVTTDDTAGVIRMYVGEGEFTDDPIDTMGGVAVCRVRDLQGLMHTLCENGFEHHVAMVRGHVADVLVEACEKYLGWDVYRHA